MKKYNLAYAAALVMTAATITGCSDDKTYDFEGDPYNRVYVADYSGTFKLVQTPALAISGLNVPMVVKCNQVAKEDINVTFVVDNALVEEYNAEFGTAFAPVPAEALGIENYSVVIPAGEMKASEEFVVKLTDDNAILTAMDNADGYLLPVRIDKMDSSSARLSTNMNNISYFTLAISHDNIDGDATAENRQGTLVSDRSGWKLVEPTGEDGSALFDGDAANALEIYDDPTTVIVDLGKEYTFDGIMAKYAWAWGSWSWDYGSLPQGTEVYTSSNGTSFTGWGETKAGSSWSAAEMLGFMGPVTARYIKLVVPGGFSCGDFNIYAL